MKLSKKPGHEFLNAMFADYLSVEEKLFDQSTFIAKFAKLKEPVLICGETGSGKEKVARIIHKISSQRGKFIPVNCGGINEQTLLSDLFGYAPGAFTGGLPKGKEGAITRAEKGTLFLDEIGDMPQVAQIALLRFLQDKNYQKLGAMGKDISSDVRIICATNKDLKKEIKDSNFREDLFYRINTFTINIPPLSPLTGPIDRTFATFFLKNIIKELGRVKSVEEMENFKYPKISPSALNVLNNYNYPGNFRELNNILKYAFVKCDGEIIRKEDLPDNILSPVSNDSKDDLLSLPFDQFKAAINKLIYERFNHELEKEKGRVARAAKNFGFYDSRFQRILGNAKDGRIL